MCSSKAAITAAVVFPQSTRVSMKRRLDHPHPVSPCESRKRVRFEESRATSAETLQAPSSPLEKLDSVDEWANVWYGPQDMEEFHGEARTLCRLMRAQDAEADAATSTNAKSNNHTPLRLAKNASTRGLEQRCCLERQRRKYLTTRVILQAAQAKLRNDPNQLAALARRCNAWATTLAIQEAEHDHARAMDNGESEI